MEQAQTIDDRIKVVPMNQHHIDPEKDKPRNKPLVRMRVSNRGTVNLQVLENTISPGTHDITVYADEVPKVLAMVEDNPAAIAQARRELAIELARQTVAEMERWEGTAEDMAKAIEAGDSAEINEAYARVLAITPTSLQGVVHRMLGRDIKPLESASVIEGSEHPEPQRAVIDRELNRQTESMAAALDKVLSKHMGAGASKDEISALVEAKVKELLGESKAGASKK